MPLLSNIAFGDPKHGWAADRTSGARAEMTLLVTADGGVTSQPRHLGAIAGARMSWRPTPGTCRAWRTPRRRPQTSLLMATSDGGKSWHEEHVTRGGSCPPSPSRRPHG